MVQGVTTMTLRFPDPVMQKFRKLREKSKATSWEKYFMSLAGIEEEKK